jgi:hypothetical protein
MAAAYLLVGIVGGVITFVLIWPHGFLLALVSVPIGASLLVVLVAVWKAWSDDEAPLDGPE